MSMRNKGPGIHYKFAAPENLLGWVPGKHNIDKPKEKIVSEEIVMEEIFAIWKFLRGFVRKFPATHSHNIRATMKLQRWLRKVERGRELEQMKSHFQEMMIHKFVLCIYAWRLESQSWRAFELFHVNEIFHPSFSFLSRRRRLPNVKQLRNTCYDINNKRNQHHMVFWSGSDGFMSQSLLVAVFLWLMESRGKFRLKPSSQL